MARGLTSQLYTERSDTRKHIDSLFSSNHDGTQQPTTQQIVEALRTMASHVDELTIFLDALDESRTGEQLLTWIRDLFGQKASRLRLIVTSRPEEVINSAFSQWTNAGQSVPIQTKVVNKDIQAYIQAQIRQNDKLKRWRLHPKVQEEIERKLMEKAGGM